MKKYFILIILTLSLALSLISCQKDRSCYIIYAKETLGATQTHYFWGTLEEARSQVNYVNSASGGNIVAYLGAEVDKNESDCNASNPLYKTK